MSFLLELEKKTPGKSEQCIQDIVLLLNYKKKQKMRDLYTIYIYSDWLTLAFYD